MNQTFPGQFNTGRSQIKEGNEHFEKGDLELDLAVFPYPKHHQPVVKLLKRKKGENLYHIILSPQLKEEKVTVTSAVQAPQGSQESARGTGCKPAKSSVLPPFLYTFRTFRNTFNRKLDMFSVKQLGDS